jgi:hypothetical protein
LIGHDLETGAEIEMGGGLFPIEPNVGEKEAYADALETVPLWLAGQSCFVLVFWRRNVEFSFPRPLLVLRVRIVPYTRP